MHLTTLHFPQIQLPQRDGHKLRGYFAQQFGAESDLFHNHAETGKVIYRYPSIQYKVVEGSPMVLGLAAGAPLLVERFLRIKELAIEGRRYMLEEKNLKSEEVAVGMSNALHAYEFVTPWLALNQSNFAAYQQYDLAQQKNQLTSILTRNILNFFKAANYYAEQQIMIHWNEIKPLQVQFKNQKMTAFLGHFVANVELPNYIGLGKSVARGFGTIQAKKND